MSQTKALHQSGPLASRIKRMMQSDEDVGKVAKASPVLIAAALEKLIEDLVKGSLAIAESRGGKNVTAAHLKAHIMSHPLLDFCKGAVANAPDLLSPEEEAEANAAAAAKRARPRSQSGEGRAKRGRGGRGGRGRGSTKQEEAPIEAGQGVEGEADPITAAAVGGIVENLESGGVELTAILHAPGAEAEEEDYD